MASATPHEITLFGVGGGPFPTSLPVHAIYRAALDLAASRRADNSKPLEVVNVPSAKFELSTYWESTGWLNGFCAPPDYHVQTLHGFDEAEPDLKKARKMLREADVIFFPGGSTDKAVEYLTRTGLLKPFVAAIKRGVVLIGHSAGLLILFALAHTDSDSYGLDKDVPWAYGVIPALNVLPVKTAVCPHANDIAVEYTHNPDVYGPAHTRRHDFVHYLWKNRLSGIAVDGNTAIFIEGDVVKVLGTGNVTTHVWADNKLVTTTYTAGDSFSLEGLRVPN